MCKDPQNECPTELSINIRKVMCSECKFRLDLVVMGGCYPYTFKVNGMDTEQPECYLFTVGRQYRLKVTDNEGKSKELYF
jgi:hypothetical protein